MYIKREPKSRTNKNFQNQVMLWAMPISAFSVLQIILLTLRKLSGTLKSDTA